MQILITPLESGELKNLPKRFDFELHADARIFAKFNKTDDVVHHMSKRVTWWINFMIASIFDEIICIFISENGNITMFDQSAVTQRTSLTLLDAIAARKESVVELGFITIPRLLSKSINGDFPPLSDRPNAEWEAFVNFYSKNQEIVDSFVEELNKELLERLETACVWVNNEFDKRVKKLASFVLGDVSADAYDDTCE